MITFHELSKFRRNPTAHGFIDPFLLFFRFIMNLQNIEYLLMFMTVKL